MKAVQYTPADYLTVNLPRRPFLTPWVKLIDLGDGRLQFRGAEFSFTLRNKLLLETFNAIHPLLDGSHTAEEIAESGGKEFLPTTITFLLKVLRAHGLLQESNSSPQFPYPSDDLSQSKGQIEFFSHFMSDAPGAWESLRQSRVGVYGSKSLQEIVSDTLDSMGIHQIVKLDDISPKEDKNRLPKTAIAALLQDVDFLVACQESPSHSFFENINKVCLEIKKPWMHLALVGTTALLGPTFIPYQSACYVCYDKRIASNVSDLEDYLIYRKKLEESPATSNEGVFLPLWSVLAGQAAMEVARVISGFAPPKTVGRFYEIQVTSPGAVGHDVLRLPRCSVCNPSGPKREAWDSTSPSNNGSF